MKALCTEVALLALRRRYPQIYTASEKLQIDVSSVNVNAKDFHQAMTIIVPASQRSVTSPGRSLEVKVAPLLKVMFREILATLGDVFPSVLMQLNNLDAPGRYLLLIFQQHVIYTVYNKQSCGRNITVKEPLLCRYKKTID